MGAVGGEALVQASSGHEEKIFVSIRLRPLNEKEIARNDVSDWECINDDTIIYRNNLTVSERSMYPTGYTFGKTCFDYVISVTSSMNHQTFASQLAKVFGFLSSWSIKSIPHCCKLGLHMFN